MPTTEEHDPAPEGGDPACWAHLVCPVCGRMREGPGPHACDGDGTSAAAGPPEETRPR